ncbi:hypothetical protein, partial [Catellatospora sp. NPDC049609]|uniref:hypothetical protein n=1 Tax=Catellatospora sp. NPDC049609 TaxID=3155505 RepID=UPI00341273D7
ERLLAAGDAGPVAVGVDERHARGLALRRLADAVVEDLDAVALPETAWSGSPAARRWWKALTLRFGHPAWVHVRQPAPGVVHAEIACGGEVVAWAVEADAGDAVAFAALAAVAAAQARAAGAAVPTGPVTLSGAAPVWRPSDADTVAWSAGWDWPAGAGAAEDGLQQALRSLPQLSRAAVWTVDGAAAEDGLTEQAAQLRRALGAVGFTVVRWAS